MLRFAAASAATASTVRRLSTSAAIRAVPLSSTSQVVVAPPASFVAPFYRTPSSIAAATRLSLEPTRKERRTRQKKERKLAAKAKAADSAYARAGVKQSTISPYVRTDRQFKTFKPLTSSLRWTRYVLAPHLHKGKPERALTVAKRRTGGRNSTGRVTVRGRGGGHKRRLRLVDFYRFENGEQDVLRVEYDPGRSAHIALIQHRETKLKSYILAPEGLGEGDTVRSYRPNSEKEAYINSQSSTLDVGIFRTQAIRPGNVLPLHLIPIGTMIHAISLTPVGPARMVRSAGAQGQLISFVKRSKSNKKAGIAAQLEAAADAAAAGADAPAAVEEAKPAEAEKGALSIDTQAGAFTSTHAQVKLTSGEVRLVSVHCVATIGRVSNSDHEHVRLGKAGRMRWLGFKPKVRGVAMNACDHPHGGGRGKSKSNMHPRSIYGHKTKGPRTRKPGTKGANMMVIRERPRRNGKRASKG